jgi:hypothetical protein
MKTLLATVVLSLSFATLSFGQWLSIPMYSYDEVSGSTIGIFTIVIPKESKAQFSNILLSSKDGYVAGASLKEIYLNETIKGDFSLFAADSRSNYYGEGNHTSNGDPIELSARTLSGSIKLDRKIDQNSFFTTQIGYRERKENLDKQDDVEYFPFESYTEIGVGYLWDTRDQRFNATKGASFEAQLLTIPKSFSNLEKAANKAIIDARYFKPIKKTTLALRGYVSHVFESDPSYLNTNTLGSMSEMRGIQAGRYRGQNVTLVQTEFRFPIFKFVKGSVFYELGRAGDMVSLQGGHSSYGFAIHLQVNKNGANYRFSRGGSDDSNQTYVNFNHAF